MRENQAPVPDSKAHPRLRRRLLDFGRRVVAQLFGRRKKKNPNIYPLY